jgi:hypothetical protein
MYIELKFDHEIAKAFRGELVSESPNDEPASVLLERIRTERATRDGAKLRKSSKPRLNSKGRA